MSVSRQVGLQLAHAPLLDLGFLIGGAVSPTSALELGLKRFVTFDDRQGQLAAATGLKVVVPTAL